MSTEHTKRLFIPSGINTQQKIADYKPLGPKSAKFADKYNYLLHYLICARCFDKRLTTDSYIPVNAKQFEKYVTWKHSANILRFWIDNGVIEREPCAIGSKGYVVGEKSISYRFSPAYSQVSVIDMGYLDEKFEKKVAQITKEFKDGKLDLTIPTNAFIKFNLQELRIDVIGANQYLHKLVAEGTYSLDKANIATVRVQAIRDKDWFCKRDLTGHRIHNNWVTFNKRLKRFCYIETGEQLVNIDVCNSQPVILCILLKQAFKHNLAEDVIQYIKLCEAGKFYEFVAGKFGVDIADDDARTSFKKKMFKTIFYGENVAAEKYAEWQCFKKEFPTVARFITRYKAKDYTALSIMLQRIESEIMLEGVIGKIAARHNPEDFFALTIHDSITTTFDNQEYVLGLMKAEFALRGINPSFETKAF